MEEGVWDRINFLQIKKTQTQRRVCLKSGHHDCGCTSVCNMCHKQCPVCLQNERGKNNKKAASQSKGKARTEKNKNYRSRETLRTLTKPIRGVKHHPDFRFKKNRTPRCNQLQQFHPISIPNKQRSCAVISILKALQQLFLVK